MTKGDVKKENNTVEQKQEQTQCPRLKAKQTHKRVRDWKDKSVRTES